MNLSAVLAFNYGWDTLQSPADERRRAAVSASEGLMKEASPARGSECAKVTVVVFSDFQCPYCRRVSELIKMLPDSERRDVNVVFKHRPLSMHSWAREAALVSICASSQSNDAFWALHDFLMESQHSITPNFLHEQIEKYAGSSRIIDTEVLKACMAGGLAEATLARDEKLGDGYRVQTTPTLFINGVRRSGLPSVDEFRAVLRSAPVIREGSGYYASQTEGIR